MKLMTLAIMAFLGLMLAMSVNAVTITNPGTLSGTLWLNATATQNATVNCTFSLASAALANTTSITAGTDYNDTVEDTGFNVSFDTTALEDCTDIQLTVTCYNETGEVETATTSSLTADNTIPTAVNVLPADGATVEDGSTYTATVIARNTTGCTLHIGVNKYTMTHSGATCTYTTRATDPPDGDYDWYVTATDGTNTTDSSKYDVLVESGGGGGFVSVAVAQQLLEREEQEEETKKNYRTLGILALIGVAIWYFKFRKKK